MARWTAKVFVDSTVGEITANVEAGTFEGAEQQIRRIYGPVTQIVNLRQVNGGGGGGSSSGGSGCLGLLVVVGIIAAAIGGGGDSDEKKNLPMNPPETIQQPQSQVFEQPTYVAPEGFSPRYEAPQYEAPRYEVQEVAPVYGAQQSTPESFDIRDTRRNGRDR